jgi:hypothetical protein
MYGYVHLYTPVNNSELLKTMIIGFQRYILKKMTFLKIVCHKMAFKKTLIYRGRKNKKELRVKR